MEAGQFWKVEHGYIYIVETGKRLVHYKTLRQPEQRAALTKLIHIEALLNYLRLSEAQLVLPLPAVETMAQPWASPVPARPNWSPPPMP